MIIFHHNDMDGRCAAAIAFKWGSAQGSAPIELIEVDYNIPVPVHRVKQGDLVVIVDFSLTPEVMKTLVANKPADIIWIDHHSSTASYDYSMPLKGLRNFKDKGPAACELAWSFFFPGQPVPPGVTLIGDLDAWRLKMVPDCFRFHEGLRLNETYANGPVWQAVLNGDSGFLASTLARGELCCAYRDAYCRDLCEQLGYDTSFAGHKAFACNLSRLGSMAFGNKLERYPICISYSHDGNQFNVTLYTAKPDIDIATICQAYGGGGHREAGGFSCQSLPFVKSDAVPMVTQENKSSQTI